MITVLGWDGSPPRGRGAELLDGASLVVGGRRQLDGVALAPGTRTVVLGDLAAGLDVLAEHVGDAVVLASGDPGLFGVVRAVRERGLAADVLPAVSAVAAAFARVGLPWDDAAVVSAHGRALRPAVNVCLAARKVAVLTGPGSGPAELGAALVGSDRTLVVATDLGGDTESVVRCTPAEAAGRRWPDPNVVLVLAPDRSVGPRGWLAGPPRPAAAGWALPEAAFAHRDSLVTKSEVRALALARLGPRAGALVWDVGAGSGSVAVECARLGAAAVAVERDPASCGRIAANAAAHDVDVRVVHGSAPAALAGLPAPDAVFVGGGGTAVVSAVVAGAVPDRVVVALAAVDRVGPVRSVLADAGYAVDGVQLAASRFAGLPDGSTRLAATNPVFLLWGDRR